MKKNIIAIVIIIIIFVLVVGAVIVLSQKSKSDPGLLTTDKESADEKAIPKTKEEEKPDPLIVLKSQLSLQARSFIEHYGTYSSDSGYSNLKALLSQMSTRFTQKTLSKIAQGMDKEQGFFSLTTRVTSLSLKEFDPETKIIFSIQVQEQEIKPEQTNLNQKIIEITFIKENDQWKVDEISYKQ